ncbi:hypothetical protein [Chitinolyticbacter meiyuanensis]|uniref:hypothetical protein n=1 Tax=Chitinolyticbacter meiyuanensis TaxID=682798 RepID=UPI0011E5DB1F|nr:hypothetical protein [Chitinolyticbacter meiyuanensis]
MKSTAGLALAIVFVLYSAACLLYDRYLAPVQLDFNEFNALFWLLFLATLYVMGDALRQAASPAIAVTLAISLGTLLSYLIGWTLERLLHAWRRRHMATSSKPGHDPAKREPQK